MDSISCSRNVCSAEPLRTRFATMPAGVSLGANSCRNSWMARMVRSVPATEKSPGSATRVTLSLADHAIRVRPFSDGGQSTRTRS